MGLTLLGGYVKVRVFQASLIVHNWPLFPWASMNYTIYNQMGVYPPRIASVGQGHFNHNRQQCFRLCEEGESSFVFGEFVNATLLAKSWPRMGTASWQVLATKGARITTRYPLSNCEPHFLLSYPTGSSSSFIINSGGSVGYITTKVKI